ncbi:MAG: hypothetical protein R3B09_15855 [Nannocystaceae bacterium]
MTRHLALIAALVVLGGCSDRFTVEDGVLANQLDLERNHSLEPVDLHAPYLLGAGFAFLVRDPLRTATFEGWTVEAEDPTIAEVTEVVVFEYPASLRREELTKPALFAGVEAVGVGHTTLLFRDGRGRVRAEAPFEVAAPTRVQYLPAAPLLVAPETREEVETPKILSGGTATFLVRYLDSDRVLYGTLDLDVGGDAHRPEGPVEGLPRVRSKIVRHPWLSYHWLQVSPPVVGSHAVDLVHDEALVDRFEFEAVPAAAIAGFDFHALDEGEVPVGERRRLALRALDAAEQPIEGVDAEWALDGRLVDDGERGDIVGYTRETNHRHTLTAKIGALEADVEIHGEDVEVASSNNIELGCALGDRRAPPWLWLLVAPALRRRRSWSEGADDDEVASSHRG